MLTHMFFHEYRLILILILNVAQHASLYDEWKSAQAVLNAEEKRKARENCIEWYGYSF